MADREAGAFAAMGFSLFAVTEEGPKPVGDGEVGASEGSAFLEDFNDRVFAADSLDEIEPAIWEEDGAGFEVFAIDVGGERMLSVRSLGREFEARRELLQRANEQSLSRGRLIKEVQKKEMLLRCIVHDLGNPLATVIMNLQRVERLIDDESVWWSVHTALEQAIRQRGMIRSVIDVFSAELASLEEFEFDPAAAPDLLDVLRSIVSAHRELAAGVGVRLELRDREVGLLLVRAEVALLERVIENLMANAVRHGGGGTLVSIGVTTDDGWAEVVVDDQGPGVPPGMEDAVFDPHVQAGPAAGQSGLGLFFCKRSIERWGGEIGYANREGGGARFWFRLKIVETLS